MPDLSIIIINFNCRDDILKCLISLQSVSHELSVEIIIVDNGSTDDSCVVIEKSYPAVQVIRTGQNLGFAAGCNVGIQAATGRHVMLLNPDTEVLPGALPQLLEALDAHPQWGAVGPCMLNSQDRPYPAARRFPTPFFLFCECTRLIYLLPHSKFFARYFYGDRDLMALDDVDQIEGSALVISGAALKKIGGLDERFFLFFEEVDWCYRLKQAGFENHIVPLARIRHHQAKSMSRFYRQARQANAASAMHFFRKHHGDRGYRSIRRWMGTALWIRQIVTTLYGWFGGGTIARLRADGAKAERQIYRQGIPRPQ
jgi:GT2 family glycosyltransferase